MSQYTKAGWSVHELDANSNSCPSPLASMIVAPKGKKIQIVSLDAFNKLEITDEDIEISRANAHLISAAPDMYEALRFFIADHLTEYEYLDKGIGTATERGKKMLLVRAVLTKAEGKDELKD